MNGFVLLIMFYSVQYDIELTCLFNSYRKFILSSRISRFQHTAEIMKGDHCFCDVDSQSPLAVNSAVQRSGF